MANPKNTGKGAGIDFIDDMSPKMSDMKMADIDRTRYRMDVYGNLIVIPDERFNRHSPETEKSD